MTEPKGGKKAHPLRQSPVFRSFKTTQQVRNPDPGLPVLLPRVPLNYRAYFLESARDTTEFRPCSHRISLPRNHRANIVNLGKTPYEVVV